MKKFKFGAIAVCLCMLMSSCGTNTGNGAIIGADPRDCKEGEWGIAVIGQGAVIKAGQVVLPKQIV